MNTDSKVKIISEDFQKMIESLENNPNIPNAPKPGIKNSSKTKSSSPAIISTRGKTWISVNNDVSSSINIITPFR